MRLRFKPRPTLPGDLLEEEGRAVLRDGLRSEERLSAPVAETC
jgi:hypothetical protein